tara:strand:- start:315 stop:1619 length:1305 start_codon:yes stop_codon:yes gene_type:complete
MYVKIFRNLSILILAVLLPLSAQLLDAVLELPIETDQTVTRTTDGFIVAGTVTLPDSALELSGAVLRLASNGIVNVSITAGSDENNVDFQEVRLFPEPYSNRTIAVSRYDTPFTIDKIHFTVKSSSRITILSFGILDAEDNDIYPEMVPGILRRGLAGIEKPVVISRDEWNANPPKYNYTHHPYFNKLTLHHAAGWQAWTMGEGKKQVKAIQEFHQDGRGWNDIGYHFLVDLSGNIYQGRPEIVIGAHVGGANTGNIGVCILGCYHPPETGWPCYDTMTKETENALTYLYAWIADTYAIAPQVLLGHRDYFGTTVCPGDNVWPLLPGMREDIELFIASGGPPDAFQLLPNYPNPFNAMTTIPFRTTGGQSARIVITDLLGKQIASLEKNNTLNGYNEVHWNGRDLSGLQATTGIYLYALETGGERKSGKMVYLK